MERKTIIGQRENSNTTISSGHPPFTELSQSASKMEPTTYSPDRPWISNYALILKPSPTEEYPGPTEAPMMIGVAGVLRRIAMLNSEGVEQEYEMEIGYALHPDFTGKGYGVEAVQGFLDLYWSLPGMFVWLNFLFHIRTLIVDDPWIFFSFGNDLH
jgi:RimJ/RimL family protein N-acetyltransferase